jgi:hypothetical protein
MNPTGQAAVLIQLIDQAAGEHLATRLSRMDEVLVNSNMDARIEVVEPKDKDNATGV